jgi:hypothetical protein
MELLSPDPCLRKILKFRLSSGKMEDLWNYDLNLLPSEQPVFLTDIVLAEVHTPATNLSISINRVRPELVCDTASSLVISSFTRAPRMCSQTILKESVPRGLSRSYLLDAFIYCSLKSLGCYLFSFPGQTPVKFMVINIQSLTECINTVCFTKIDKTSASLVNSIRRWFIDFPYKRNSGRSFVLTVQPCWQDRMLIRLRKIASETR